MLIMLKDYSISIGPFIDPLNYFKKFKSALLAQLSTKYQNKTNVVLNITNFVVYF
jgi:hypothetical protein